MILDGVRIVVGTEVKGERNEGAKRQPLDRTSGPDANGIRGMPDGIPLLTALGREGSCEHSFYLFSGQLTR
jgi:hypothetical protein